jgi:hypothetical protein
MFTRRLGAARGVAESALLKSITTISNRNEEILASLLQNATNPLLSAFFDNCMDRATIDSLGVAPLQQFRILDINVRGLSCETLRHPCCSRAGVCSARVSLCLVSGGCVSVSLGLCVAVPVSVDVDV